MSIWAIFKQTCKEFFKVLSMVCIGVLVFCIIGFGIFTIIDTLKLTTNLTLNLQISVMSSGVITLFLALFMMKLYQEKVQLLPISVRFTKGILCTMVGAFILITIIIGVNLNSWLSNYSTTLGGIVGTLPPLLNIWVFLNLTNKFEKEETNKEPAIDVDKLPKERC